MLELLKQLEIGHQEECYLWLYLAASLILPAQVRSFDSKFPGWLLTPDLVLDRELDRTILGKKPPARHKTQVGLTFPTSILGWGVHLVLTNVIEIILWSSDEWRKGYRYETDRKYET